MEVVIKHLADTYVLDVLDDKINTINDILSVLDISEENFMISSEDGEIAEYMKISDAALEHGSVLNVIPKESIVCCDEVIPVYGKTIDYFDDNYEFMRNLEAMKVQFLNVEESAKCNLVDFIFRVCKIGSSECLAFMIKILVITERENIYHILTKLYQRSIHDDNLIMICELDGWLDNDFEELEYSTIKDLQNPFDFGGYSHKSKLNMMGQC